MIHPCTTLETISSEKGIGVVATEFIPKGTIVWALDDMDNVFTHDEADRSKPMFRNYLDRYSYRDADGNSVLCWDHARYVHHSYNSNCIRTPYGFELCVRDILPGEELTCDYGYLNIQHPVRFPHESDPVRKMVYPDDLLRYHEKWDALLIQAFKHFNIVDQPLWGYVNPAYELKVRMIALGKEKMDSILNCYYRPQPERVAA